MPCKKTIVELVQARDRAEKRVLRVARTAAYYHPMLRAVEALRDIDRALAQAEREARRAVKRLSK